MNTDRLLIHCAQSHFAGEPRAATEELVRQGIDWEYLLASAGRHGLLPLLWHRLRDLDGELIPPPVVSRLKHAYYASLVRNMRLGDDLEQVVTALRQAGVEIIVLKGGALARTVYANLASRPMADLDFLVRPEDMERIGTVLEAIGFRLSSSIPAHMRSFQKRFGGGLVWLRPHEGHTTFLDVQHHLIGVDWCWHSFRVEPDRLWKAARPLSLNGTQTWQLSAEDTLVHLCLHPPLHHGYAAPFMGYVDMDRVISQAGPDFSWPRFVERVERFQVRTAVYYGLLRVQRMLGTPLPAEVLEALWPGGLRLRALRLLAPLDEEAVLQGAAKRPSGVRQVLLYAALADRVRDVWGMVRGIFFPSLEWLAARYSLESGRKMQFYRLAHPLRVARAFLRGLHRPLVESSLE